MNVPALHTPTVLVIMVLLVTVMTSVIVAAWRFNRGLPGLGHWALGIVCSLFLMFAVTLRERLPDVVSILVAQTLIPAVAALTLAGCAAYVSHRGRRPLWAAAAVAAALTQATYFTVIQPDPELRTWLQSALTGALYVGAAHTMARGGVARHPARYLFALALGLHAIVILVRPALLFANDAVLDNGTVVLPGYLLLESLIFYMLVVVNMVMLVNEHIAHQLRLMADQDGLTQVFNRRAFMIVLEKACSQAKRLDTPLVIMVMDLDHFKKINDTWGHKTGDDVLRGFVETVTGGLRHEDVMGRLGGEEFCIFLPNTDLKNAREIAERLRLLSAANAIPCDGQTVRYSVSIGLAQLAPNELPQAAIHRADQAMYRAKRNGRNRTEIA